MVSENLRQAADAGRIEPGTNAFGRESIADRVAAEMGADYEVRYTRAPMGNGSMGYWLVVVNRNVPAR